MKILFVNREADVLAGLRSSLRRHRRQWEMDFVPPDAAVRQLAEVPYDVVVSDLASRGTESSFLQDIAVLQPGAIRVVLSASSDLQGVMRAVPWAHQYLGMPCEAAVLIERIERSEELRRLVRNDNIAVLGSLDKLPTPRGLVLQLREALQDPDVSIAQVADLVEQEPAMAARILQLVNSAFFARVRRVSSVRDAVGFLGLHILQGLTLQIGVFDQVGDSLKGLSIEEAQQHGLQVGTVARRVAGRGLAEDAFTAGLLHDLGKVLLAMRFGAAYGEAVDEARGRKVPVGTVEAERFGVTHTEAGAYLLGVWGLPDRVVEGVAWHHDPCRFARTEVDVIAAVHIADAVVTGRPVDPALVAALALRSQVDGWRARYTEAA